MNKAFKALLILTLFKFSYGKDIDIKFLEEKGNKKFPLGREISSLIKLKSDNKFFKIRLRLQGIYQDYEEIDKKNDKKVVDKWVGYLRRERLELKVGFNKNLYFGMDLRNDRSSYKKRGLQQIKLGNAYIHIGQILGNDLLNIRLFKAKLDVSRTEFVKSTEILHFDRPLVADYSAQFISYNRNNYNLQIFGNWKHKVAYQFAIGKGVNSEKFKDVKGKSITKIGGALKDQGYFYGGKIILSPFNGWEEFKRTETYFGEGKHIEFGLGYWRLPNIKFVDRGGKGEINRTLLNYEFSFHYRNLFLEYEYFKFKGIERDFNDSVREIGNSDGWYIKGEIILPKFFYIAPFGRYECWNRWDKDKDSYKLKSKVIGLNWYLKGNSFKIGIAFQEDNYGVNIGDKKIKRYKILSQIYF